MKNLKRRIITILASLLLVATMLLAGCEKPTYRTDSVNVAIKSKYKDEFLNEAFEFDWDNIKSIEYVDWYETYSPEMGLIVVYLQDCGKNQVLEAVEYFNSLDYVYFSETIAIRQIL